MRISVFTDLRFTESATPTGVGKHIEQMVFGLTQLDGNAVSVLAASDQMNGEKLRPTSSLAGLPAQKLPLPWKTAEALWTLTGGPPVDRYCHGADWVYCPKNDFIPLRRTKLAVTIHGAHELDPAMPQPGNLYARLNRTRRRMSYERIVSRADLVLTVSEFLKNQIIDWFGCAEEKIAVVGNGVEQVFFDAAKLPWGRSGRSADRPYLLCVGGLNEIDGGEQIIQVARLLVQKKLDLQIVVAGHQHEKKYIDEANALGNVEILGYVAAPRLAPLMRDAVALLYLTKYETFGIAAAEAMAAGTPVITSGGTAVPEVVGSAGLYVSGNPHDVIEKISDLSVNTHLCNALKNEGQARATEFTWRACVQRLHTALWQNS